MSSSIFSSEQLRALRRLPRRVKWRALVIALDFVLVIVTAKAILVGLFKRPTYQELAIESLSEATDTILLGNSRLFNGINPSLFSRPATNFSFPDGNYQILETYFFKYIDRAPRFRHLIIGIDASLLTYEPKEGFHREVLAPAGLDEPFDLHRVVREPLAALRDWLEPVYRWRVAPQHFQFLDYAVVRPGFIEVDARIVPGRAQELMADKVESLTATYTPEVYARNLAALRNVVAYARSKDARIAFLMFPLRQEWMSYEPQHLHGHVTKALETVAQDAPIEVWDYRVWPRLETKHFSSYDHLNVYGARIFSREIDGRLYDPAPSMNP